MGINFNAKLIDPSNKVVGEFDLNNYRANRVMLTSEELDAYGGEKTILIPQAESAIHSAICKMITSGYDNNHPGVQKLSEVRDHLIPLCLQVNEKYQGEGYRLILNWG